jgi:hypothetical protein
LPHNSELLVIFLTPLTMQKRITLGHWESGYFYGLPSPKKAIALIHTNSSHNLLIAKSPHDLLSFSQRYLSNFSWVFFCVEIHQLFFGIPSKISSNHWQVFINQFLFAMFLLVQCTRKWTQCCSEKSRCGDFFLTDYSWFNTAYDFMSFPGNHIMMLVWFTLNGASLFYLEG